MLFNIHWSKQFNKYTQDLEDMDGIDTYIISLFNVFNCQVFINQLYTVLEYAMQSDCVLKKTKLFIYTIHFLYNSDSRKCIYLWVLTIVKHHKVHSCVINGFDKKM